MDAQRTSIPHTQRTQGKPRGRHGGCVSDGGYLLETPIMSTTKHEQRRPDERSEEDVDKAVEDTFPASDAPATGGPTKIGDTDSDDVAGRGTKDGDDAKEKPSR
jgi:hypothetical protein